MARFATTVDSSLDADAAFELLANFESVADWDPGVSEAQRLDAGDLRVGSAFRVVVVFGVRRIPLTYVIKEIEPGRRVVLEAETGEFTSYDVITVAPADEASEVTYDATLTLHGWRRPADALLRAAFAVVGKRAEAGLRKALNPVAAQA